MDGWTTLGQLPPGTLFEDGRGRKSVRSSSTSEYGDYITTVTLDDGQVARDRATLRVRRLPSPLTEEDCREAKVELRRILDDLACCCEPAAFTFTLSDASDCEALEQAVQDFQAAPGAMVALPAGASLQPAPQADPERALRQLLWLLEQPAEFLGLLQAAATSPADRTPVLVLSDWLKERGCEEDGKAMAEGWRKTLVKLVLEHGGDRSREARCSERGDAQGRAWDAARADEKIAAIRRLIGLKEE